MSGVANTPMPHYGISPSFVGGQEYHIAVCVNTTGQTAHVYINGIPAGTKERSTTILAPIYDTTNNFVYMAKSNVSIS